jgi:hypothetical protein
MQPVENEARDVFPGDRAAMETRKIRECPDISAAGLWSRTGGQTRIQSRPLVRMISSRRFLSA